jgi:hypothetical protein
MSKIQSRGPMPPELRERWERALADVDRDQFDANFAKTESAASENSFSGFVRRCVHRRRKPLSLLAKETDIELEILVSFLRGDGELNAGEIGRVLAAVGVELVETPTANEQSH